MILNPEKVMIDFELTAKKAFEIRFNRIRVIGCLFHFGQSLFKIFCKLGLKQSYENLTGIDEVRKNSKLSQI